MDIINKIEPSGTQRETLQKNCKPLYDYVRYVSKIKENKKLNMPTEEAVNKAVDWLSKKTCLMVSSNFIRRKYWV